MADSYIGGCCWRLCKSSFACANWCAAACSALVSAVHNAHKTRCPGLRLKYATDCLQSQNSAGYPWNQPPLLAVMRFGAAALYALMADEKLAGLISERAAVYRLVNMLKIVVRCAQCT